MTSVVHDFDTVLSQPELKSRTEPTRQRERQMRKFTDPGQAQRFLTTCMDSCKISFASDGICCKRIISGSYETALSSSTRR